MRMTGMLLCSTITLCPVAALADDADSQSDSTILVVGEAEGYGVKSTVSATRTNTPLIDVPQTIQVVTRDKLDDQAQYSIADVLRYVPGTTVGQGEGNRDQITLRGQNTTADFFLDGVRDDVQYYRGLYNIERVEILKGPSALTFGRGGGGGVINRVQKTPVAATSFVAARTSVNSFGAYDISVDVNAPISDAAAVRVNATFESFANHRDFYDGERYAVNPYIAAKLGDNWTVGLSYEYVHDDRVTDRGVPSLHGRPISGFDRQFFGVPGINRAKLEAHIAKLRLDGQLTDNLGFSSTVLYGDYDKIYINVFPNGAATGPLGTVALDAYSDPTKRENLIAQGNLVWDVTTGAIGHKILVGLEYGDQKTANSRFNRVFSPGTSFNLLTRVFPTVTFTTLSRDTRSTVTTLSAYVQDQISIGDHIELVAGVRYDRFKITGTDLIPAIDRDFGRKDDKISPRVGVILKPQESVSIYGSFSRSFLPRSGDQFTTLSVTDENLAPERFTNYEIGAKWDIRSDLHITAALFRLDRDNATIPHPTNPLINIKVDTRTKGLELAVNGRVTPEWQVSGGYSWTKGYRRNDHDVVLAQLPRHQFALWNRYDFSDAVGVGLGVIKQSGQFAAIRTSAATTRLPGYTRVDAALFLTASERLSVQLNVENLLDKRYYSDAHNNNNISPGAPINGRLTARVKF